VLFAIVDFLLWTRPAPDQRIRFAKALAPGQHKKRLASIIEVSEQPFRPEDGGELRPDTLDGEQHCGRRWRGDLLRTAQRIPLSLHSLDLIEQQFQTNRVHGESAPQVARQRTAVTGLECIQSPPSIAA